MINITVRVAGNQIVQQFAGATETEALTLAEAFILSQTPTATSRKFVTTAGPLPAASAGEAIIAVMGPAGFYSGNAVPNPNVILSALLPASQNDFEALNQTTVKTIIIEGSPEKYSVLTGLQAAATYLAGKGNSLSYRGGSSLSYVPSLTHVIVTCDGILAKGTYSAGSLNLQPA